MESKFKCLYLFLIILHQMIVHHTKGVDLFEEFKNLMRAAEGGSTKSVVECYSNYDCNLFFFCLNGVCKRNIIDGIGPVRRQCPDNCQNFWRCDWLQGKCIIKQGGLCSNSGDCPRKFVCAKFSDSKLSANSSTDGFCVPGIILGKFLRPNNNNGNPIGPNCSPQLSPPAMAQNGPKCSGLNGIYYVEN